MASKKANPKTLSNYSAQPSEGSSRRYHAFLLRLWQEEEGAPWRIQMEHPQTHELIGFHSLERLVQFLNEKLTTERQAL